MAKKERDFKANLGFVAKTSVIVFIGIVLSKILTYAYRVLIARFFGPETYGIFSLALVIVGFIIIISALGLSDGILRYVPLYRGKKNYQAVKFIVNYSTKIILFSSILLGILLFVLSSYISNGIFQQPGLNIYLRWFSLLIPITAISYPFLSSLRAFEKIKEYSFIFNILQNLSKVILLSFFLLLGIYGDISIIVSHLISMFVLLAVSYYACRKLIPVLFAKSSEPKDKDKVKKSLFAYSWPLMFFGIVANLFSWIDTVSIGLFKGTYEIGLYNAAMPIALLLMLFPEMFMQLFLPLVTREYAKKNTNLIKELSKQVNKWIFALNVFSSIILFIFAKEIMILLFGVEYASAFMAVRVLVIGNLIYSLSTVSINLLSMAGKAKTILTNILIAAGLNFLLNYYFIPMPTILGMDNSLGIVGASVATTISLIVLTISTTISAAFSTKVLPLRRKMFEVIISGIIVFFVGQMITSYYEVNLLVMLVSILVLFLLYFLILILTRSLDSHDKTTIKSFLSKLKLRK